MLDVEVFGAGLIATPAPSPAEMRRLCVAAAGAAGVHDGHVAIEFVDAAKISELNGEHRSRPQPTDVLSFPIDGVEPLEGEVGVGVGQSRPPTRQPAGGVQRELGDVVICPQHTSDLSEAIVHGMLHLLGMDHETDDGEMLALQRQLLDAHRP